MEDLAKKFEETEIKKQDLEIQTITTSRDIIKQELETVFYVPRLQNIPQKKDEQLYALIAQHLVLHIDMKSQDFQETDHVFRYNTDYSQRNYLTLKIHVKFVRRHIRDRRLKPSQNKQVEIDKKIRILKEIFWKVRQIQKQYTSLTKALNNNEIQYIFAY